MFSCKVFFVFLIWSNALINPQKWLKKRFKDLNSKIQHLDSKTDRIDQNVKIIKGELGKSNFLNKHSEVLVSCSVKRFKKIKRLKN